MLEIAFNSVILVQSQSKRHRLAPKGTILISLFPFRRFARNCKQTARFFTGQTRLIFPTALAKG
jgi:hypothetical protein